MQTLGQLLPAVQVAGCTVALPPDQLEQTVLPYCISTFFPSILTKIQQQQYFSECHSAIDNNLWFLSNWEWQ